MDDNVFNMFHLMQMALIRFNLRSPAICVAVVNGDGGGVLQVVRCGYLNAIAPNQTVLSPPTSLLPYRHASLRRVLGPDRVIIRDIR